MYKSKNKWSSVGLYIFLGIILVFMIVPFIWLVISSFRPGGTTCIKAKINGQVLDYTFF